jgi:mRNA-degrading endonuclease YafQ of YafQ-DinJ toxin-antitoxin module
MRIVLTEHFQTDVRSLAPPELERVLAAMLVIPRALGDVHTHAGLGLRKVHRTGVWEARVGLNLRLILTLAEGTMTFVRAGSHDEVKRFLRDL